MPGRPTAALLYSGSRLLLRPAFRRAAAQSSADPQSSSSSSSSHRRERLTPNFFTPNETLPQPMQRGGARSRPPPPGPPPPPPPPIAHAYYEAPRQWIQEETERQDWYRPEMSQRGWGPQRGGYYGGQYSGAGSSSDSGNGLSRRQDRPKQGREREQQQQHHPHSPFNGPGPGPSGRRSYHSLPPRPPSDELYGGSPSAPRHTSPAGPRHSSPSDHRHASPSYQRRNSPSSSRNKMLPLAIRSDPRPSYMALASQEPSTYPLDSDTPRHPLPLLVLDLNGSLVFRGSGRSNNSAPARRPYLSSFLAYCLGFDDASYATKSKKKGKAGGGGGVDDDEAAARRRRGQWVERDHEMVERYELYGADPERPHGCHFASPSSSSSSSSSSPAPGAHPSATTHLLIWSSAQPQNVDAMIKSMLHPAQAEQLVRCWGRDTLVPHRFYNQKSPSVKDLEIVWDALRGDEEGRVRGERRVLAEERDREDREVMQREQQEGQQDLKSSSGPWGPHNTLLLDDSPEKARLQPFNHLLVPEFDGKRARIAEEYRAQLAGEHDATGAAGQVGDDEPPEGVDTVLLQAVGVLEHARYQKNVAAWIRSGGLGRFAGVEQPGASNPAVAGSADGPSSSSSSTSAPLPSSRRRHSRWECELEPNLDAAIEKRTEAFWRREGRRALLRNEVAVIF